MNVVNEKREVRDFFVGKLLLDINKRLGMVPRQEYLFLIDRDKKNECWCVGEFENDEWIKCEIVRRNSKTELTSSSNTLVIRKSSLEKYLGIDEKIKYLYEGITPNEAYSIYQRRCKSEDLYCDASPFSKVKRYGRR